MNTVTLIISVSVSDFRFPSPQKLGPLKHLSRSIFPEPAEYQYALKIFSSFLDQTVPNDKLIIFRGSGSNGKSVLMDLFSSVFGDYAITLPQSFFTFDSSSGSNANPVLAGLKATILAFVSEPAEGKFRTELVKKLCGADSISARNLWSNTVVKFKLTSKFVISMNELPSFTTNDEALWRRILILPFRTKFCSHPKHKYEKVRAEDLTRSFASNNDLYNQLVNLLLVHYSPDTNVLDEMPESCKLVFETVKSRNSLYSLFCKN